ncbi:hypothetical protein, partial [Staphylococcus aureus]
SSGDTSVSMPAIQNFANTPTIVNRHVCCIPNTPCNEPRIHFLVFAVSSYGICVVSINFTLTIIWTFEVLTAI